MGIRERGVYAVGLGVGAERGFAAFVFVLGRGGRLGIGGYDGDAGWPEWHLESLGHSL